MMIARARGDTTMEIVGALPEGDKHRLHFLIVVVHGDVVVDDHPDTTDVIHHDRICPPSLSCIEVGAIFTQLRPSAQFTRLFRRKPLLIVAVEMSFLFSLQRLLSLPSRSYRNR